METTVNRIISVCENNESLFFECRLNTLVNQRYTDIRLIANRFDPKFKEVNLYDIDYKPKDLNNGYFCPVVYETDGGAYLLETNLNSATYQNSKERLDASASNGFIVKLTQTKYCIFSIDKNTNKKIVESGLSRTNAKDRVKELNKQLFLLEFDYEIEDEFFKGTK